ncbi:PAS domain-containing protein [Coprinopsis sp. MPI-PUGE-AT-0042]|nr:PAS domain-containing protein [Coprinopsis sp. MPI-PUGE-AT-0042]
MCRSKFRISFIRLRRILPREVGSRCFPWACPLRLGLLIQAFDTQTLSVITHHFIRLGKKPARDFDGDVFDFKVPKTQHTRRPSLLEDYHDHDAAASTSSSSSRPRSSSNSRLYEEASIPDPTRARIAAPLAPPPNGTTAAAAATAASQTLGLPIYSATGFDLLSVLARIATRPNPRVPLGPVDMSCSFVVTDTRRHDHPIIYCSPNFLELTGYSESEILGRNCRFLQSPCGISGQRGAVVGPGDPRPDSATASAAWHLKKCLDADKEVQVVITNYKKDGTPFTNHVTVIPVPGGVSGVVGEGEENDVVFQVGFQVDLTEQPSMILEKLKNGSYLVDYSTQNLFQGKNQAGGTLIGIGGLAGVNGGPGGGVGTRERRTTLIPKITISKQMKRLLNDPGFVRSIPITASMLNQAAPLPPSGSPATAPVEPGDIYGGNHPLHLMLLETGPDFVHVVSLKGTFLYVAPSVRNVLGYEPEDLAGKSISDLAHPEDVVPLMRELKESSTTGISAAGAAASGATPEGGPASSSGTSAAGNSPTISTISNASGSGAGSAMTTSIASTLQVTSGHAPVQPRTVDLLFRARTKNGAYVWVESRGRLHVEPGKGRKAIILSGRAREIPRLNWGMVIKGGGLAKTVKRRVQGGAGSAELVEEVDVMQEFWGTVSPSMVLLMLGKGFEDVLGWNADEWKGRSMKRLLDEGGGGGGLESIIKSLSATLQSYEDEDEDVTMDEDDERGSRNRRSATKAKRKDLEAQLVQTQCRMRHKDGRLIDVIVNVFRCERDPKVVASTRRNTGGVTPAPLIVQVRLVGAEMYTLLPNNPSSAKRPAAGEQALSVDPNANMFEELDISRGSSWQYELQQLKYANQRLKEDIRVLEAAVGGSLSLSSGTAGSSSTAAPPVVPSQASSSGRRTSYSGGNESSGGAAQPFDAWSSSAGYFSTAPLPSRATNATPSSSRGFGNGHHLTHNYEPPSPSYHDFSQQQLHQEQEQYLARAQAQHLQSFQSQLQAATTLHHPRQPSQSRPQTASTPISISTPATALPSLADWPSSAGLGPSPFVQRIQQEALNNPGGVSVSVSVPVRAGTGNAASAGYQLLKRSWNGTDGPASSR